MILRSRNFVFILLFLHLKCLPACSGQTPAGQPFGTPPEEPAKWHPDPPAPRCLCAAPGNGSFDVRLNWGGRYLTGRAKLHLDSAIAGARLIFDPRLALQKTSWPRGADCSAFVTQEGCTELPASPAGAVLEFEFGFRHEPWSETTRMRAFAFPSLFAVTCPAHCRRPLGRWPAKFSMRRPSAPTMAVAAGMPDGTTTDDFTWDQPAARLALVVFTPPPATLEADLLLDGYGDLAPEQVLPQLHPFTTFDQRPQGGRLHVVFEPGGKFPWGLLNWRFVSAGTAEDARLAEISARIPAWIDAPVHAREGAVTACRLAELDEKERIVRLKKIKLSYLQWVQRGALADPVHAAQNPTPPAYWTLLFMGTLQRSDQGPGPGDCTPLLETPQRPARLFHEVLADLGGRIPYDAGSKAPAVSVSVESITPRKDTVVVKISNKSKISLWLPIIYKTDKDSWNHWVFLRSTGKIESLEMQHTGKPVDILIDPDNVTVALPFGWTEEGPPEDLNEP